MTGVQTCALPICTDARILPGNPIVGHAIGIGGTFAGALDTPQGPGTDLSVAIVAASLADNSAELVDALRGLFSDGVPPPPEWVARIPLVGERIDDYWRSLATDQSRMIEALKEMFVSARALLVQSGGYLAAGLLQLTLSVLVAFFLFRDGEAVGASVQRAASRVGGPDGQRLLQVAGHTISSVVYGILGTALAQGVLAGIGFVIAGVPGALLLGLATF